MKFSLWTLFALFGLTLASPLPELSNRAQDKRDQALNTFLAILLDHLPTLDGTITEVVGVLTAFENVLAFLTGQKTTYNELGGSCKAYTVIFARGTTEPGNVGILVGPPLFQALRDKVSSSALTIQGVNKYSASIDGYLTGGDKSGSAEM